MITFFIIAGALLCFFLLMLAVLFALLLLFMHRGETPAELAYCPVLHEDEGTWEGTA